ncbi:hypothetical protein FB559_5097 [Actinoallomurus bryophytorum]|uniref:Uncharacterized protein n=1 Tax=Actinoallomurus bryophytorum TaxID=1490222 RepID=A0A543CQP1_9ACTN|nr:hypothetical protein FB559_5097 [Actinoallomurus bryophytorum]
MIEPTENPGLRWSALQLLSLLPERRAQPAERHRLEVNGGALDEKITHYEKALGEQ